MKTAQHTPHAEALDLQVISDADEEGLDVESTEWFKSMKAEMTPGKVLRAYRFRENLTKEELISIIGFKYQPFDGTGQGTAPGTNKPTSAFLLFHSMATFYLWFAMGVMLFPELKYLASNLYF